MNPVLWQDTRLTGSKLTGDTSQLYGDASQVTGNVVGLRGNITGVQGALDGIRGDLDACGLQPADRQAGVPVMQLVSPNSAQIVDSLSTGGLTAGQLETALGEPDMADQSAQAAPTAPQGGQSNASIPS